MFKSKVSKHTLWVSFFLKLLVVAFVVAAISWFLETMMHAYVFKTGMFSTEIWPFDLNEIWPFDLNEMWMRFIIAALLFVGTLVYGIFYYQKIVYARQLELTSLALHEMNEAAVITDKNNNILYVNQKYCEITGYSSQEVIGKNPRVLSSGRQGKEFYQALWQDLQQKQCWQGEIWNRKKNGEHFPEWISIKSIRDAKNQPLYYVAIFTDITSRKAADDRIKHYAFYDPLTDLPNRYYFDETLTRSIIRAKRLQANLALLFLDLDKFKPVNDTYGHAVGDLLLIDVSRRMQEIMREGDFLARIGGDEFVLLLYATEKKSDIEAVIQRCLLIFEKPFIIDDISINIGISIGGASAKEVNYESNELIALADKRMYSAKKSLDTHYSLS